MDEAQKNVLSTSKDPLELLRVSLALARSSRPEDHRDLQPWLIREEFLARLDSEDEYAEAGRGRLRIKAVVDALANNQSRSAGDLLLALTQSPSFNAVLVRTDMLIAACAGIRPPPAPLLKFWDDHCRPMDSFTPLTIDALVVNGTAPAIELLERKFADPTHGNDVKCDWMHNSILPHQNDVELLRGCRRLLAQGLPVALRPALVEAIFDYRPDDWYPEHLIKKPPPRASASADAKRELREIAEYSLTQVPLGPELREKVKLAAGTTE
jgi:hypothetical protein